MNEKLNLFFIESPLQLISATQARDHFNISDALIFIYIYEINSNNHTQIINELDDKWGEIHFLHRKQLYIRHLSYILMLFKLSIKYKNKVERFFCGDYTNPDFTIYEAIVSPDESILLDDGTVTIAVQKNHIQNKQSVFKIKGLRNVFFKKILTKHRTPNLFSFFDLSHNMLPEQVNYYCHKDKTRSIPILDCFYFVGSILSEGGYMSKKDELLILKIIFKQSKCSDFHYIPHRGESNEKLIEIESIGYKIKNLNQPLETFYKTTTGMPIQLISYFSTALYTCHLSFGMQVNIVAVDVRKYLTSKLPLHKIDTIYDYYSDVGITIQAIEE